jgi:hypothetical protein
MQEFEPYSTVSFFESHLKSQILLSRLKIQLEEMQKAIGIIDLSLWQYH